jgi:hypothetical protein
MHDPMELNHPDHEVSCCGPEPLIGFGFGFAFGPDLNRYQQRACTGLPVLTPAAAPEFVDMVPDAEAASELTVTLSGRSVPCSFGVIADDHIAAGYTLTCCSLPLNRVNIEV